MIAFGERGLLAMRVDRTGLLDVHAPCFPSLIQALIAKQPTSKSFGSPYFLRICLFIFFFCGLPTFAQTIFHNFFAVFA